jgi:uncharacterized RDD family membrane protein YckC
MEPQNMSSTEPPSGEPTPPPPPSGGATPPPPPPPPAGGAQYGAPQYGTPPPPAGSYGAPAPGGYGDPAGERPGELLDRFLARLLDGIIIGIPTGIVGGILTVSIGGYGSTVITSLLYAAVFLGYFGFMESSRGTTIGKQVLKLRVVGPDGQSHPTMEQAIRRNIYYGFQVLGIIPILGWLAQAVLGIISLVLLIVGINTLPDRRTWFDKFAGGAQVLKHG